MSTEDIDNAAKAFDQAMGVQDVPASRTPDSQPTNKPIETVFENFGEMAENSESVAGGDHDIEVVKQPVKKPVKQAKAEEDDEVQQIGGPDDIEYDENGDPIPQGDEDEDGEGADDNADDEGDGDDEIMDTKVQVMVDGEEEEVTIKEALEGYIRTKTFHKRMNEVNDGKNAVVAEAQNVIARRNAAVQALQEIEEIATALIPQEPDWDKMYDDPNADVKAIRALQKQYETLQGKITEIKTRRTQAEKDAEEEETRQQADFAQKEFTKWLGKNPKIQNQADVVKELGSMRRTALAVGFSDAEVSQTRDSRMLLILQKASKYDRMMAARPKPVKQQGSTTNKSSTAKNGAVRKDMVRAQKRLSQTGGIDAAADVFAQIIR